MRISDWSSDVCSADLSSSVRLHLVSCLRLYTTWCRSVKPHEPRSLTNEKPQTPPRPGLLYLRSCRQAQRQTSFPIGSWPVAIRTFRWATFLSSSRNAARSEEHTSELQSLMRSSYAVFCLKKKKKRHT